MEESEMKTKIVNRTKDIIDLFNNIFPDNQIDSDYVHVFFNLSNSCAGIAYAKNLGIEFNLRLALENEEDFILNTVPHEVAHLFQRRMYPYSKPHGKEWKYIMRCGGFTPIIYHNYFIEEKQKRYPYKCGCRTWKISGIINSQIIRGQSRYCPKCGQNLIPVKEESKLRAFLPGDVK